jgi:hypothetical protein
MGNWILGVILGVVSLIGLLVASRTGEGAFHAVGLLLFAFCILGVFTLIHRNTGHPTGQH